MNPPKNSRPIEYGVTVPNLIFNQSQHRPGQTSLPIINRPPPKTFAPPITKKKHTYTREFKIAVLLWWQHGLVCDKFSPSKKSRPPTRQEVSQRYKVPMTTLWEWKENVNSIVDSVCSARANRTNTRVGRWPEMEETLYKSYKKRRNERKSIRRGWLRRQAVVAFKKCYPTLDLSQFPFSNGWFFGFLSRHNITLRFTTNTSQKIPEEYLTVIINWFQFNRRNSQLRKGEDMKTVGRYLLDSICNMDETPIPFEYLNGQTYADKGSHSVQVKSSRGGWDKRQATLVLTAFASGKPLVKPLILFKGCESYDLNTRKGRTNERKRQEEMAKYDSRVAVKWNPTAYANSDLLIEWINELLVPALPSGPRMLVMDVAKFHKTDKILNTLRSHDIIPSMVPAGCTGLVQPLDVSINKPLKNIFRDLLDEALDLYQDKHQRDLREEGDKDVNSVAERRIIITHCVGTAWERFCKEKKDTVIDTFRKLGISLPIDGSCDNELSVKGINPNLLCIGNWRNLDEKTERVAGMNAQSVGVPEEDISEENDYSEAVELVDR